MNYLKLFMPLLIISVLSSPDARAHPGHTAHRTTKSVVPANPRPPKTDSELPTTSATVFLYNFNSQMTALKQQLSLDADSISTRKKLAELMYSRAQYQFDLVGQQRAIDELTYCISRDDSIADLFISRAKMQQSLHRFVEAQADVIRAIELGAPEVAVRTVQQELDWNSGNYQRAILAIRNAAKLNPNPQTLARLARLEHDLGNYSVSDRRFEQAEDAYTETHPLTLSWLNIQRGLCQVERANYRPAVRYFREATRRMPGSLASRSQLAESLHAIGESKEAVEILESILEESTHPEFLADLAVIYRELGETARANDLKRRATEGFGILMRDFPEAMAGHASHFFLTEGNDPRLALRLTQQDVKLRPNSNSYLALARAQLANNLVAEASASLARALKMPVNPPGLAELRSTLRTLHPHAAN